MGQGGNFIEQAGAIPYRWRDGSLEVLTVTSLGRKDWIFPKGLVEAGLSPQQTALQEAFEEAGVTGQINNSCVGSYQQTKRQRCCQIELYLLKVTEVHQDYPEKGLRKRKWASREGIQHLIVRPQLHKLLLKALTQIPPETE